MFLAKELTGRRLKYREKEFSLTFDDGPTEGVTAELGRLLQTEGISATFFVLGESADGAILRRLVDCGHRIGNHTYSHQNLDSFAGDHGIEIPQQIGGCHVRIERFSQGRIPFRAPGGAWSNPRFTQIANRLPFAKRYIGRYGWDVDACDWRLHRKPGSPDKIRMEEFCRRFESALDAVSRGIILMHDGVPANEAAMTDPGENRVIEATRFVIDTMRRRNLRIVPLKEPSTWF